MSHVEHVFYIDMSKKLIRHISGAFSKIKKVSGPFLKKKKKKDMHFPFKHIYLMLLDGPKLETIFFNEDVHENIKSENIN